MIDEKAERLSKLIVVVDEPAGRLASLVSELHALGFRYTVVGRLDQALELAQRDARTSLVAVDERVDRDGSAGFVAALKELHPALPILWMTGVGAPRAQFGPVTPDALLHCDATTDILQACLTRLLREACYPMTLVTELLTRCTAVLREGFATEVVASEPFLRANRVRLAPMTALINFFGAEMRGHLLISGSVAAFAAVRNNAVPGRGDAAIAEAGDVAGELANQMLGRLAEHMRLHTSIALGVPLVIEGIDVTLRATSGEPALVVPLVMRGAETAALWVEFDVHAGSPDVWSAGLGEAPALGYGDVKFFPEEA